MSTLKRILNYHRLVIWLMIAVYFVAVSLACLYKYFHFGYNSLDLGIINQVFYNSSLGSFFASSIHAPSYLGDHFKPIIFLVLPFYFVFRSPIALLLLQTLFLALAAWPLYLIAKKTFVKAEYYLLLPLLYLTNPIVLNTNFFEFHLLPLLYLLGFFAFYFYQARKLWPFAVFIVLSLMVREDVALFIFCFGLFILVEKLTLKKKLAWPWFVLPLALSALYFPLALKIISTYNVSGYKFWIYYAWLGATPWLIIKNSLLHPLALLGHLFIKNNLELTIGLLAPFTFIIPLRQPKYLILLAATYFQLALSNLGGIIALQTHYGTLLNLPLFLATAESLKTVENNKYLKSRTDLIILALIISTFYTTFFFGPRFTAAEPLDTATAKQQLIASLPKNASVISSTDFLAPLSSRAQIYLLNYSFLGKKQFSDAAYILPPKTDYLLADFNDTLIYQFQYGTKKSYAADYASGDERLRQLLEKQKLCYFESRDTIILFKQGSCSNEDRLPLVKKIVAAPADIFSCQKGLGQTDSFSCELQFLQKPTTNYQLEVEYKKTGKTIFSRFIPLAYGFWQTSNLEPTDKLSFSYSLLKPSVTFDQTCVNLVSLDGSFVLNRQGSNEVVVNDKTIIATSCLDYLTR